MAVDRAAGPNALRCAEPVFRSCHMPIPQPQGHAWVWAGGVVEYPYQYAADPEADFNANGPTRASSSESPQADQVDPVMGYPFELNDTERANAVQSTVFVVPS